MQIQKADLLGDFVIRNVNTQRDCFVADAPRKDTSLSLRAKRSNLTEHVEVEAINYEIDKLRAPMTKGSDFSFGSIVTDDEFNEQAGDALAADPVGTNDHRTKKKHRKVDA